MITVWWSAASLIHYSFLNPGEAIPSEMYAQQVDVTKAAMPAAGIGQQNDSILLCDNARPHVTQ